MDPSFFVCLGLGTSIEAMSRAPYYLLFPRAAMLRGNFPKRLTRIPRVLVLNQPRRDTKFVCLSVPVFLHCQRGFLDLWPWSNGAYQVCWPGCLHIPPGVWRSVYFIYIYIYIYCIIYCMIYIYIYVSILYNICISLSLSPCIYLYTGSVGALRLVEIMRTQRPLQRPLGSATVSTSGLGLRIV